MLRTRIADGRRARRPGGPCRCSSAAVVVTAAAALAGLACGRRGRACWRYLGGLGAGRRGRSSPPPRRKPPARFPAWSVLAGAAWLAGCSSRWPWPVASAPLVADGRHARFGRAAPVPSPPGSAPRCCSARCRYLVPVVLGGGPRPVRAANAVLDRAGALRSPSSTPGCCSACCPVPSVVRVLVLRPRAARAWPPSSRCCSLAIRAVPPRRRRDPAADHGRRGRDRPAASDRPGARGLAAGLAASCSPSPPASPSTRPRSVGRAARAAAGVAATGRDHHGRGARPQDMRFTPSGSRCPPATGWSSTLTNADDGDVHDLVLDTGADIRPARPGERRDRRRRAWSAATSTAGARSSATGRWAWCCDVAVDRARPAAGTTGDARAEAAQPPRTAPPARPRPRPDGRARRRLRARRPGAAAAAERHACTGGRSPSPSVRPRGRARASRQQLWTFDGTAPGPDAARQGRRRLRDHPGQRRHDRALDRLPRRRRSPPTGRCAPSRPASP